MVIQQWPEEVIALNKELASGLHPSLEKHLAQHSDEAIELRLARLAAWVGIEVDATFDPDQLTNFCELIRVRLIDRRERPDSVIVIH